MGIKVKEPRNKLLKRLASINHSHHCKYRNALKEGFIADLNRKM
jgi:hypothetical protein